VKHKKYLIKNVTSVDAKVIMQENVQCHRARITMLIPIEDVTNAIKLVISQETVPNHLKLDKKMLALIVDNSVTILKIAQIIPHQM